MNACAYCGAEGVDLEREHVVPACLYPASKASSTVQRITVPACSSCNRGWADDEAHFRTVMLLAGESNNPVQELWPRAKRSFDLVDGQRRLRDIFQIIERIQVSGVDRLMIYPGRDERVLRVVRKVVRGLAYFHGLGTIASDRRVWTDVLKYRIQDGLLESVTFKHREPDVFQYWFEAYDKGELSSIWYLKFFEKREFIASVAALN
jgi:hypothetical protein